MKKDTIIESGVQLIPYIGSSIATLYFGNKEQKKFERLESFYQELATDLEKVKSSIASIDKHSEEELILLIEEINERIENERVDSKRQYYKNLYKKSLIHPVKNNFNERKYFADLISQFTELHFRIIRNLFHKNKTIPIKEISIPDTGQSLIQGFIQQLDNSGILTTDIENINVLQGGINMHRKVKLTELGRNFHYFCMEN